MVVRDQPTSAASPSVTPRAPSRPHDIYRRSPEHGSVPPGRRRDMGTRPGCALFKWIGDLDGGNPDNEAARVIRPILDEKLSGCHAPPNTRSRTRRPRGSDPHQAARSGPGSRHRTGPGSTGAPVPVCQRGAEVGPGGPSHWAGGYGLGQAGHDLGGVSAVIRSARAIASRSGGTFHAARSSSVMAGSTSWSSHLPSTA